MSREREMSKFASTNYNTPYHFHRLVQIVINTLEMYLLINIKTHILTLQNKVLPKLESTAC